MEQASMASPAVDRAAVERVVAFVRLVKGRAAK
jgi:hypothetical protein